jgi:hypothetical protein
MLPVIPVFGDGLVSMAGFLYFRASAILSAFVMSRKEIKARELDVSSTIKE